MAECFLTPCPNEAEFVVNYTPCCRTHLAYFLDLELGPQPDGRKGSTMIPVGLVKEPADG